MSKTDYKSLVGYSVNHRGLEGVIVAYDTKSYREPMLIVAFANGIRGALRPTELGAL